MPTELEQLLQILLANPATRQIIRNLMNGVLGTPPMGLDYLSYDPTKTIEYNVANQRREDALLRYFSTGQSAAYAAILNTATANTMRFMGYDYNPNAKAGWLAELVGSALVEPKVRASANAIARGFYSRAAQWDPEATYAAYNNSQQAADYLNTANAVIEGTLRQAARREYGGLGMEDVGKLVGEYARLGGYDYAAQLSNASESGDHSDRSRRIAEIDTELQKYAESVNMIRDVINGPLEKILASFESLTGSNLVATSTGRVSSIASALRNVVSTGIIDENGVGSLTGTQFGLISPMGGSLLQASAMALSSAAALSAGVRIEGLSQLEFGNALAKDNARMMANGDLRTIAAAYVHWRQTNGKADNADNKEEFIRRVLSGSGSLADQARAYLADKNVGGDFLGSAVVTGTMADPNFITTARLDYARQYDAIREDIVNRREYAPYREKIRAILHSTYDLNQIQERLANAGVDVGTAARLANELGTNARLITGADTWQTAMAMIGSSVGAANIMNKNLAGDAFRRIRGKISASGLDGVLNLLMDPNSGLSEITVERLIKAALGVEFGNDPQQFANAADAVEKITRATKVDKNTVATLLQQAANAGASGEAILFARHGFKKDAEGNFTEQLTVEEGLKKKQTLLAMLAGKKAVTYELVQKAAEGLELSDQDINRIYLQSLRPRDAEGVSTDVTDDEVASFVKYRDEYKAQGLDLGAAAEKAEAKLNAKKLVDAKREDLRRRGEDYDAKSVASEIIKDDKFRGYAKQVNTDAQQLAELLAKRDGLEGVLEEILTAVRALGKQSAGDKQNWGILSRLFGG